MNIDQGKLNFATGIDNDRLMSDALDTRNILHSIGQTAQQEGNAMDAVFNKVGKTLGSIFAIDKATEFVRKIMDVRGEIESLSVSYETLLGNKEKAAEMFQSIRDFAVNTPMQMKDLAKGAQTMLGFNIEAEKVMPMLKAIGDISMGNAQKFGSLTLAFSQMSATGRLMGQDLLQMINGGFNPLSVISEQTGKSIGQLKEEMEKGKISADMITQAFIDATSEGGKFYGMLDAQSKTMTGAISNLQGAIDDMLNDMGAGMQDTMMGAIDSATYLAKNYEVVLGVIASLVAGYGAYRAALAVNIAIEGMMANARAADIAAIEAQINAVAAKTTADQLATDAKIAEAVAQGQLTEAEGLHLLALKQEASLRVQVLAEQAAQAKADTAQAILARKLAAEKVAAAVAELKAKSALLVQAEASQDMFAIGAAKQEMENAAKARNIALSEEQAAITAVATAKKAEETAATAAKTAAQELDTISMNANATATGVLTTAISVCTKAIKGMFATMAKHPVALIIAALAALAIAIYNVTKKSEEATIAQKAMNDVEADASSKVQETKVKIDTLSKALHDNALSIGERKKALDTLRSIVPAYHAELDNEGNLINDNTDALNNYIAAMLKAAKVEAIKGKITSTFQKVTDTAFDYRNHARTLEFLGFDIADDKYKKKVDDWYNNIINDPKAYTKMINGKFYALINGQYLAADTPKIGDEAKALINALEEYVTMNNLYDQILNEEIKKPGGNGNETKDFNYWDKRRKDKEAELKALGSDQLKSKKALALVREIGEIDKELAKYDVKGNRKAGQTAADKAQNEAAQIALRRADSEQKIQDYAIAVARKEKDAQFEIRQASIDAMADGVDKELLQIKLNYDRMKEENIRRQEDMVEALRDKEEEQWSIDNPKAKDEGRTFDRSTITAANLSAEQLAQIKAFSAVAENYFAESNRKALEKMLADVATYEQERAKIIAQYAMKEEQMRYTHDEKGKRTGVRQGVSEGNFEELNRQKDEALAGVDEQFAQREESYQSWCNAITDMTLENLKNLLQEAEDLLAEMENDGDVDSKTLSIQRAKVNKLKGNVKKKQSDNDVSPKKRSIKEWEDLYKVLNDCEKEFEEIGDAIGGTVGEIISTAGTIASTTLQMVNGIVTLVNSSKAAIEGAAVAGATAISTMEKASVILTIISAAFSLATAIVNMFNNDDKKQKQIEHLQSEIDQLQWELEHEDISRMTSKYGDSLDRVRQTLYQTKMEIASTQTGWERIITIMGRASANQEVMQKTAKKLAETYATMSYTADKALGEKKYASAQEQLENIAKQQILINEQIGLEKDKKKTDWDSIQEMENKIEELGQQALTIINEMVEDIVGGSSNDIANELADAFIEAFQAGEDAAEAWGDKVNEIVADVLKRMLVAKYLEEPLGQILDKYKAKWFPNGQFAGLDAVISSMEGFASDLNSVGDDFAVIWDSLPDSIKGMFTVADNAREAADKGIASASQESIDELNGRVTAIQSHTYSISENTKILVSTTQNILRSVMNIESETNGLGERMTRVETHVRNMASTLDDMSTKGILLKR